MARINTEPCVNVIDNDDNDDIEDDDDDDDDDGINKNDDDDDYDEKNGEALTIICCPASHWSGRNFLDRNTRLRCSFAFSTTAAAAAVGRQQQVPSSSLSLLSPSSSSSSSYEVNKDAHSNPMEAVQIHIDLRSKRILSIAEEFMDEPPRELEDAIIRIIEEEEQQQQQQQRILENHHSTFHIDIGGSGTRSAANSGDNNNSGDDAYTSINFKVLGHGDTLVLKK
jgi:hypothetical protein